jgi:predicted ABC-class ATPase
VHTHTNIHTHDKYMFQVRAEDGRAVSCVDLSPFINNLPFKKDTKQFSTADASGSTSQAANIDEVLHAYPASSLHRTRLQPTFDAGN